MPARPRSDRTKPNAAKKRGAKRKKLRLAKEARRNEVARERAKYRADVAVVAFRKDPDPGSILDGDTNKREGEVVFAIRRGLLGHQPSPIFRVPHTDIVGAVESTTELGAIVTKLGVLVLSQMLGYNLAYGTDELAKSLAKFAGIDLVQLAADAEISAIAEKLAAEGPAQDKLEIETTGPAEATPTTETIAALAPGEESPT